MSFLSRQVDIPRQDQETGKVEDGYNRTPEHSMRKKLYSIPFNIKSNSSHPDQAAVAVRYRDSWFYIDDTDLKSKPVFSLLTQLFALQSSAIPVRPPVLTLPVDR